MSVRQKNTDLIKTKTTDASIRISTWGAIVDKNNSFWLSVLNTNSLIKGDEYGRFNYIGELLFSEKKNGNCIIKVIEHNDKLFFFSKSEFEVCIVDKNTMAMTLVSYWKGENKKIADIVKAEGYAVILTSSVQEPAILFNMENFESEILGINNTLPYLDTDFIRGIFCRDCIYTATRHLNSVCVCKILIKEKKSEYYMLDVKMISSICFDDSRFWVFALTFDNKTVLRKYDKSFQECLNEYAMHDVEQILESGLMHYFRMEYFDGRVFMIPSLANSVYVYDMATESGHFIDYPSEVMKIDNEMTFVEAYRKDSELYLFPCGLKQILRLNFGDESFDCISIDIDEESTKTMLSIFVNDSSDIISEGHIIALKDYLSAIRD